MSGEIRARPAPRCRLCGREGEALYEGLGDRLFSAPGRWSHRRCPGEDCGLVWLDPMPLAEDLHLAYASYYTHAPRSPSASLVARGFAAAKRGYVANRYGYSASALQRLLGLLPWLYPGRPSELDFSVMWLHAGGRGRLLDVGAGSGWLVEHMASLGWQAEGLDFDAEAVRLARERGLAMHQGALEEQRFAAASFDAVTMSHSIEHVPDPAAQLAEARRILRPGGRLAIATPNARSFGHRRFGAHWFALDPPRHLHLFTSAALGAAMCKAGFTRCRIFTSARDANGAYLGSRAIRATGRFDMASRPPPAASIAARIVQLSELVAMSVDRDGGSDLVALAVNT